MTDSSAPPHHILHPHEYASHSPFQASSIDLQHGSHPQHSQAPPPHAPHQQHTQHAQQQAQHHAVAPSSQHPPYDRHLAYQHNVYPMQPMLSSPTQPMAYRALEQQQPSHANGGGAPGATDAVEEPLYVNAKQYHRILKRRAARARLEELRRIAKARKPYLHESRHRHAMRRPRGPGGRFLTAAEVAELERTGNMPGQENRDASSTDKGEPEKVQPQHQQPPSQSHQQAPHTQQQQQPQQQEWPSSSMHYGQQQ